MLQVSNANSTIVNGSGILSSGNPTYYNDFPIFGKQPVNIGSLNDAVQQKGIPTMQVLPNGVTLPPVHINDNTSSTVPDHIESQMNKYFLVVVFVLVLYFLVK